MPRAKLFKAEADTALPLRGLDGARHLCTSAPDCRMGEPGAALGDARRNVRAFQSAPQATRTHPRLPACRTYVGDAEIDVNDPGALLWLRCTIQAVFQRGWCGKREFSRNRLPDDYLPVFATFLARGACCSPPKTSSILVPNSALTLLLSSTLSSEMESTI